MLKPMVILFLISLSQVSLAYDTQLSGPGYLVDPRIGANIDFRAPTGYNLDPYLPYYDFMISQQGKCGGKYIDLLYLNKIYDDYVSNYQQMEDHLHWENSEEAYSFYLNIFAIEQYVDYNYPVIVPGTIAPPPPSQGDGDNTSESYDELLSQFDPRISGSNSQITNATDALNWGARYIEFLRIKVFIASQIAEECDRNETIEFKTPKKLPSSPEDIEESPDLEDYI